MIRWTSETRTVGWLAVAAICWLASLPAPPARAGGQTELWQQDLPRTASEQVYLDQLVRHSKWLSTYVDRSPEQRSLERGLRNISAGTAITALKDHFGDFLAAKSSLLDALPAGAKIEGFSDSYHARVRLPGTKTRQILISTAPLRAQQGGRKKRLDMGVRETEDGFRPANGPVSTVMPKTLAKGFAVGARHQAISRLVPLDLSGALDHPRVVRRSVVYANAYPDTDLILQPTTIGLRLALQIRSSEAPTTFRFRLPDAGTRATEAEGNVVITGSDGATTGMDLPTANDRHGRQIAQRLGADGDTLTLQIDHKAADYAYPAIVQTKIQTNSVAPTSGTGRPPDGAFLASYAGCTEYGDEEEGGVPLPDQSWQTCYDFGDNAEDGGWATREVEEVPGYPPNYWFGVTDCARENGQRGLCMRTTNDPDNPEDPFVYHGGFGEYYLMAPPTTYFTQVRFEGQYHEDYNVGDGEWPDQCARVALYPSPGDEWVYDTGWGEGEHFPGFWQDAAGGGNYPINQIFSRQQGDPTGVSAVFRLHSCGQTDPESLHAWDAWGRLDVVDALLFDETPPYNVQVWGSLWDARNHWFSMEGHRRWDVTVAADDGGSGFGGAGISSPMQSTTEYPKCDEAHQQSAIRPCGQHNQHTLDFYEEGYTVEETQDDDPETPEWDPTHDLSDPEEDHSSAAAPGANEICAYAVDYADNPSDRDQPAQCWNVYFDGAAPGAPPLSVETENGYAQASWQAVGDEDGGQSHDPGSGLKRYEYRYKIDGGNWTDWAQTRERKAPLLTGLAPGAQVTYQVRTVDNVDNVSPDSEIQEASATAKVQPVLGKRPFKTYAAGGESFFEELTTNLEEGSLLAQKTDLDLPALGPDVRLTRTYNSKQNNRGGILGYGWELSVESHLLELPDQSVLYDDGQGSLFRFKPADDGAPKPCLDGPFGGGAGTPSGGRHLDSSVAGVDRAPSSNPDLIRRACPAPGQIEDTGYDRIPGLHLSLAKEDDEFVLTDEEHNVQRFDGQGKLNSLTDRNGNNLTYTYNTSGQLVQIADAAARNTVLSYDIAGRLSQVADAAERTTRYRYTSENELLSVTDAEGRKTCFAYDSSRRLTRTATPKLVAQDGCDSVSADDSGQRQGEAVILYDSQGRVSSLTNERHTGGGNQVAIDGVPIGASTTYEWSESVSCSSAPCVHAPSRATTAYELDENGQAIRQWDPDGRLTTKSYDAALSPTEVVTDAEPGGRQSRTAMTWDADGNRLSRIEPGHSQPTNYRYEDGDLVQKTLPSGRVTTYAHDGRHNLIRETSAPGTPVEASTSYTYDSRGNLTALTGADGRTTTYAYDANGNRSELRDPATATPSLSATYNQAGKPTELSDANGNRSSLTWSAAGLLDRQEDVSAGEPAPSHTATFSYDENAGLTSQSDDDAAGGAASDQETVFEENSQPVDSSFGVSDASPGPRDARVDQSLSGAGPAATRAVSDGEGYALGHAYEYTFHLSGALWIVARSSTDDYAGLYSYDGDDNALSVERWESDSVTQTSAFDGANRETHREFVSSRYPLTPIVDQDYSYDEDDRLVSVTDRTEAEGNAAYTYDAAGRLMTEVVNGVVATYGYDADGNRLSTIRDGEATTYRYDDRGLVTQEQTPQGTRFYYYDPNGNLARHIDELGGTTTYAWDARSRLAQVTKPDGSRVEFAYQDRTNLRTRKTVKDSRGEVVAVTEYQYDSTTGALVAELDATAGGDDPKLVFNYDALGRLVSVTVGPDVEPPTYYYDRSPRGDVLAINNKFGQTTTGGRYRYGAFGETLLRTGTLYNPIRWRGAYYDEETGLYYLQNRYYDSRTGRYLSPDPARLSVPLAQRYAYAANDPVNRAEPAGTAAFAETFDPNPFERPLARTGEPSASVDALKAQEPVAATACAVGLAHYEGRPTPRERMLEVTGHASELLGVKEEETASPCSDSGG